MFKSGSVVQVTRGNQRYVGSLWIVEKEVESVTLVYSIGESNDIITHFPTCDLEFIGKAEIVKPLMYHG